MMTNGLILRLLQQEGEMVTDPEALVIVLFVDSDGPDQARRFVHHWQPAVPRTQFLGIELDDLLWHVNLIALRRIVTEASLARGLSPERLVLLGFGEAGGLAVDLVRQGALPAIGVIAYDIPLKECHEPLPPGTAAIRLVQRSSDADPDAAGFRRQIRKMQSQNMDVRAVILPEEILLSSETPMRAGTSFLVELIAKASRTSSNPPR